jgi:hypothetical protein
MQIKQFSCELIENEANQFLKLPPAAAVYFLPHFK